CCTVRPVNNLESSGFLAKLSYEIKENKLVDKLMVIKLFGSNYARDLDIQKIEQLVRNWFTNSTKDIQHYKKAKNARRSREILSRFSCFHILYRITDTKTC
ncbi:MAG TPA: hypothetical protein VIY08_15000, partial [Candidatus Nitrosocosmicus sp.]